MSGLPAGGRVCRATGLVLVPAQPGVVFRVAKTSYGPLSPPVRATEPDADRSGWGRWDTHGGRTVYAAGTLECAFAEVLAYYRRRLGTGDPLTADAAFLRMSATEFVALIEAEWQQRGHLPPGHLAQGWRHDRAVYRLELPSRGWWVLLEHPASMAAAEVALGERLAAVGIGALDVAVLRGDRRQATVLLADWVSNLTLEDGSAAHGIQYDSRHATGAAWAYWLRRVADDHAAGAERISVLAGERAIDELDPDLQTVAQRFQLTIW